MSGSPAGNNATDGSNEKRQVIAERQGFNPTKPWKNQKRERAGRLPALNLPGILPVWA